MRGPGSGRVGEERSYAVPCTNLLLHPLTPNSPVRSIPCSSGGAPGLQAKLALLISTAGCPGAAGGSGTACRISSDCGVAGQGHWSQLHALRASNRMPAFCGSGTQRAFGHSPHHPRHKQPLASKKPCIRSRATLPAIRFMIWAAQGQGGAVWGREMGRRGRHGPAGPASFSRS